MEFKEFRAKTVNDAITEALIELEITSDLIEYEVIEEGSAGLLGLFSRDAVIRARRKEEVPDEDDDLFDIKPQFKAGSLLSPQKPKQAKKMNKQAGADGKANKAERTEKADKAEKVEKAEKAEKDMKAALKASAVKHGPAAEKDSQESKAKSVNKPVAKEQLVEKPVGEYVPFSNQDVNDILKVIFEKLQIQASVTTTINREERVVNVVVEGEDTGDIIGKRGQTLDAIQYLLSIVINKEQESYFRVKLDTNNYRERRQKTLENLAKNVASKVKKTRKKVVLEPMNPYERRVIHSYLQADKYVTTKSEGVEPNRRVVVYYKKA